MDKNLKSALNKLIIGGVVIVLAVILFSGYSLYMQYLLVNEIGGNFISVFFTNFNTQLITQVICFVIVFFVILINLLIIRKVMLKVDISMSFIKNLFPIILLSFIFAFFASGYIKSTLFERFLLYKNSVSFGISDPIFNQDFSYYIFLRPFLISLVDSFMGVFIFTTVMTAIIYLVLYSRLGILNFVEILKIKGITFHVLFNVILIILIRAISFKFRAEDMLYNTFSGLTGAGYTDINVWQKYYQIAPFILIVVAFVALILLYNGKIKSVLISMLVYPALFIAAASSAVFVQYFVVQPAEVQIEEPFIARNINYTKMAYGLDKITETEFKATNNLTTNDLEEEKQTLDNIRIIDYNATKTILSQLQGLRNYYEFKDLDITAYNVAGQKTPLAVSTRELKKNPQEATTNNYINDKLKFTHGFGVVATPVNKVSSEGHPLFYIKDIPLIHEPDVPNILEPRIYYGEYKDEYSVVNTTIEEFDYLENEKNIQTTYAGSAGIKLTAFNRLLFSIYNSDYQMLVSKFINEDSKILMNKNVVDRVRLAAPFLSFDDDPYVLIDSQGRLKWIVDGFTQTEHFPYSQYAGKKYNYMRNSVKAVVDAYDGTVTLYIADPEDKLIQAYKKIYPSAFSTEEIPADLKYSIKYSESFFKMQSDMLKRYHTTDTTTFYNKSDVWEFAYEIYYDENKVFIEPYYNMMKVNGMVDLVLMMPFTITEKDNMVSWLSAGSDGDSYGELTLYKFPQGKNVYGPMQIEKRIDSNTDISKLMTLWGQGGSTVIRGNMLTIPVKDSLIYVEPIYITSGKNTFPELKMVVAAYGDKIAMETDLKKALDVLFKGTSSTIPIPVVPPIAENNPTPTPSNAPSNIIEGEGFNQITEAFNKVQEASKQNDWEAFGKYMKELEQIINAANKQ